MNILSLFSPIIKVSEFVHCRLHQKPVFRVTLDNKNLSKAAVLTIGIWVKNLSSISHNIVRIAGELEQYPNSFRISIVDSKYRLPIVLNPMDPERIIVFIGEVLEKVPSDNLEWNIVITLYSRWKGEEIAAGKLRFTLK